MVRSIFCVIFFLQLVTLSHLTAERVVVSSEINGTPIAGEVINGVVTINHTKNQVVDIKSFKLGGKPLKVTHGKDVLISPKASEIFSTYTFTLDPKPAGYYQLKEVSVNVGGDVYRSIATTFQVEDMGPQGIPQPQTQKETDVQLILGLETIVDGPTTLYPGQQLRVGYRYIFNYSFELQKEDIPLLQKNTDNFRRIGGKDSKVYTKGGQNISEITQIIEMQNVGDVTFPPAQISGRAYRLNRYGKKDYANIISHAEAKGVTLSFLPFPNEGKPSTFNGAIGTDLKMSVSIETAPNVTVGDRVILLLNISGDGQIANLPLPELCCQPGLEGVFRQSDLPPNEMVTPKEKTFRIEMRPLLDTIDQIPSIEFSYFNPETKTYETVKSDPIPITVQSLQQPENGAQRVESTNTLEMPQVGAIEIEGNYVLTVSDLRNNSFSSWWVILVFPFAIVFLFIEYQMQQVYRRKRLEKSPPTSRELFDVAMKNDVDSKDFYQKIEEAFLQLLKERHECVESADGIADCSNEEVAHLFKKINEVRFSGQATVTHDENVREIKNLFSKLEKGKSS